MSLTNSSLKKVSRTSKSDFLVFAKWADECLRYQCHIGSQEAFMLISQIAREAAQRGQRRKVAKWPFPG